MTATTIDITGIPPTLTLRRPWRVALLSVVTLGIYWIVWYYKVNCEMRDYGKSRGDAKLAGSRPTLSLLALLICPVALVSPIVSCVRTVARLQRVERLAGSRARSGVG